MAAKVKPSLKGLIGKRVELLDKHGDQIHREHTLVLVGVDQGYIGIEINGRVMWMSGWYVGGITEWVGEVVS